jgi:hypothetical protein
VAARLAADTAHGAGGKRAAHSSCCTPAALMTNEIVWYQPEVMTSSRIWSALKRAVSSA